MRLDVSPLYLITIFLCTISIFFKHLNLDTLAARRIKLCEKFSIKAQKHPKFSKWFKPNTTSSVTRSRKNKFCDVYYRTETSTGGQSNSKLFGEIVDCLGKFQILLLTANGFLSWTELYSEELYTGPYYHHLHLDQYQVDHYSAV